MQCFAKKLRPCYCCPYSTIICNGQVCSRKGRMPNENVLPRIVGGAIYRCHFSWLDSGRHLTRIKCPRTLNPKWIVWNILPWALSHFTNTNKSHIIYIIVGDSVSCLLLVLLLLPLASRMLSLLSLSFCCSLRHCLVGQCNCSSKQCTDGLEKNNVRLVDKAVGIFLASIVICGLLP